MKGIDYLKSLLYFFVILFTSLLIITIFYYFDIFNPETMKYLKIIILLISCFLSGFILGKKSIQKGYINGLLLGITISFIFLFITMITKNIKWTQIIYYLMIIITTSIGSMLGINKKKIA